MVKQERSFDHILKLEKFFAGQMIQKQSTQVQNNDTRKSCYIKLA
uniref:Uncharacterized protein n=1 Tax=Anguilla anguilla TaxID=7936 RepID=A0A0E9QWV0_ANGAN